MWPFVTAAATGNTRCVHTEKSAWHTAETTQGFISKTVAETAPRGGPGHMNHSWSICIWVLALPFKGLWPCCVQRAKSFWPYFLPKALPPNTIASEMRFQYMNLVRIHSAQTSAFWPSFWIWGTVGQAGDKKKKKPNVKEKNRIMVEKIELR